MFYVKCEKDGKYGIFDTEDGSLDYCTSEEIKGYIKQGISISGVGFIHCKGDINVKIHPLDNNFILVFNIGNIIFGLDNVDCLSAVTGSTLTPIAGRIRVQTKNVSLLSSYQVNDDLAIFCIEEVRTIKAGTISRLYKTGVYAFSKSRLALVHLDGMPDFLKGSHVVLKRNGNSLCYGNRVLDAGSIMRKFAM